MHTYIHPSHTTRCSIQYAQHQHPREELGDADSLFKNAQGISVHCKQMSPCKSTRQQPDAEASTDEGGFFRIFSRRKAPVGASSRVADNEDIHEGPATAAASAVIALYHGFGANLWSWMNVQQELADATGATVVAHDMPGFGLTERSAAQSAYSLQTNGDIGRQLAGEALLSKLDSEIGSGSAIPAGLSTCAAGCLLGKFTWARKP